MGKKYFEIRKKLCDYKKGKKYMIIRCKWIFIEFIVIYNILLEYNISIEVVYFR